jgi:ADP-ribosylglycohydrolase
MSSSPGERLQRARLSLEGLSVGDAFGGFFEGGRPESLPYHLKTRKLPPQPWHYIDDTNMALSVYAVLHQLGKIDQDVLGRDFGEHFDRMRGYGLGTRGVLIRMQKGQTWREAAYARGEGGGSYGNGGAMRIAPLGAYFADDLDVLVEQARLSSEVTHAHVEGIAGAVAVALAAAWAWRLRGTTVTRPEFIDHVLDKLPDSEVKQTAEIARDLPTGLSVWPDVVVKLGNGSGISAQDTVPYVLWCAGESLTNYEEAIWLTASGGGDVDTTCAMVGGIVALYTGMEGIPAEWIRCREALPEWALGDSKT